MTMTLQEALDLLAMSEQTQGSLGMTPEEQERRQALIRNLASSNPDLARDVAKGPYQMNVGSPGDSATPQEAWVRGPVGGSSYSDSARSQRATTQPMGAVARWGAATPSTTGPAVAGSPPPSYREPEDGNWNPSTARFNSPQGPRNANGEYKGQPGQVPAINIYLGGPPPSYESQYPMGKTYGALSAMNSPHYPYSPSWDAGAAGANLTPNTSYYQWNNSNLPPTYGNLSR